uniref:G protein-coupled receptor n=1 Tax=Caenorhabditis tropicalis TaxID=1561998 RepID=A0A1I7UER8_9PELO
MFVLRYKIVQKLMEKAALMSEDAKASHNQILKCLIIQAFIPSLLMIGVSCYILSQLGLITHPFIEYLIFASICTMPMLSPFTYLTFIKPYKAFCMRLFHLQRRGFRRGDSNAYYSTTRSNGI